MRRSNKNLHGYAFTFFIRDFWWGLQNSEHQQNVAQKSVRTRTVSCLILMDERYFICQSNTVSTNTGDIPQQGTFKEVKLLMAIFAFMNRPFHAVLIWALWSGICKSTSNTIIKKRKIMSRNFSSSHSATQQVVAIPDFPLEKIRTIQTSTCICFSMQLLCLQLQCNEIPKMSGTGCVSDLQCHYTSLLCCSQLKNVKNSCADEKLVENLLVVLLLNRKGAEL